MSTLSPMLAKVFAAAMLLTSACSSGSGAEQDDASALKDADPSGRNGDVGAEEALIAPEGLSVTALAGGNGVLEMLALTLRKGPSGPELYAALRNEGDEPACSAALSVELFDQTEQSLAAGIGALLTQHFYRLADGSSSIAACVGPGDVTMAAVLDLPLDLAVEDVMYVVYRCPYFALDVVPIDGLVIRDVKSVAVSDGTAYTGTLVNELDVAVRNPSVTVFPINRVGRPLGMAISTSTIELPPGNRWIFETSSVATSGLDHLAFPTGALSNPEPQSSM